LGQLGKNSLFITPQFSNRVHLVSIVTDVALPADPVLDWEPCPKGCTLCRKACPVGAIAEDQQVDQSLCRPEMLVRLPKGTVIESCRLCRKVCPAGMKKTGPDTSAYFAQVAEQWDEIRAGYCTEHMRDAAIAKDKVPPGAVVADVGTGTGFVAAGLAPQVAKVYGFDASAAMLEVARRNLAPFPNVELRKAPGDRLPLPEGTLDGVFANMYLHHAPEPPAAIKEMVRVLKPGGVRCLTDLDTHNHTWLREQMADL
jgi:ferredoxin